jgi:hypothetical protein
MDGCMSRTSAVHGTNVEIIAGFFGKSLALGEPIRILIRTMENQCTICSILNGRTGLCTLILRR